MQSNKVAIDIVAVYNCPAEGAMLEVAQDNTSFHVWYDTFSVQIGPNARPVDFRHDCQIVLNIDVPAGAAYAIDRVEYGGYAGLAPGAVLTQRARHYRDGQTAVPGYRNHTLTGPYATEWQVVEAFPAAELYFPPCGTNPHLNAVVSLRLDAGTSDPTRQTSFAALDSIDGPYGAIYHLQTKPC